MLCEFASKAHVVISINDVGNDVKTEVVRIFGARRTYRFKGPHVLRD